jgi:uncharacterized iron-regulated protein
MDCGSPRSRKDVSTVRIDTECRCDRRGTRTTATTAVLMIDMQRMCLEQHKRGVFGWPLSQG